MANAPQAARKNHFESYGGSGPENYEKYFVPVIGRPIGTDLVDAASLRPGDRVLDVACGTGVVARLAADRVGESGAVAGVDVNAAMLACARSLGQRSIEWHEANVESMPLPDAAFDVVLSSLGFQFFTDRLAALQEIRRVLAAGGRLAFNVPGPTPEPWAIFADALGRHISPPLAGFVHLIFSLHEADEIAQLLSDAGFDDAEISSTTKTLVGPRPAEFLWQYVHSTPLAAAVAQADDDARSALEQEVVDAWQPFVEDDRLIQDIRVTVATARK